MHRRLGIGIGTNRAHEGHSGAQLCGRDSLVSAFAPGQDVAARAQQGLAGLRVALGVHDEIGIDGTDDG